jgi:hypothetical protein
MMRVPQSLGLSFFELRVKRLLLTQAIRFSKKYTHSTPYHHMLQNTTCIELENTLQ